MSNCYLTRTPVFGPTRYSKKYLKLGVRRMLLFLSNEAPPYEAESFHARVTIVKLEGSEGDWPKLTRLPLNAIGQADG